MTALAGRMILNEILNSDYRDLEERIDKHPEAVSFLGQCGETPAHISIYKHDQKMLAMLLKAGASPNLVNAEGNTLVHVAAQLGYLDCLHLLYDTKKCILVLKNNNDQTALDIARGPVDKAALHVLKYFAEYHRGEPNEKEQVETIKEGRRLCAQYLEEKMQFDREQKVRDMVQSTLDANNSRRQKARILRGVGGANYNSFYSDLSYHTDINKPHWDQVDMDFFLQYHEGIDRIVRTIFACDYVQKSIRVGTHNVLTRLRTKMAASTYPVPTAEALIPGEVVVPSAVETAVRTGMSVLEQSADRNPDTVALTAGQGEGGSSKAGGAGSGSGGGRGGQDMRRGNSRREVLVVGGSGRAAAAAMTARSGSRGSILSATASAKEMPRRASISPQPQRQSSVPGQLQASGPLLSRRNLMARSPSSRGSEAPASR